MSDELVKALERTRDGYKAEVEWHRFLFDAYSGAGGFEGKEKRPPSETWGSAASIYASEASYLARHRREDDQKFSRRRDASHYDNYVEPLTDLKISYLLRKQPTVESRPEPVEEWRQNVDGLASTFDELRPIVALRAAVLGWCPVLVDFPAPDVEPLTIAQSTELGMAPRAVPLLPANVADWSWTNGVLDWVKLRTDMTVLDSWESAPREVQRYTIWTPSDFSIFDVERVNGKQAITRAERSKPHTFGCVPLTICRHKRSSVAEGVGLPMHASVSIANRALFNYVSQLDEHLREQAFALMVYVGRESELDGGELEVGTNNALSLDPEASKQHYFLAPPASVADVLEKRIENTIREIYRMARVEFQRPTGGAQSGVARAYDFAATNQALCDFAGEIARWESWIDDVVGRGLGVADDVRAEERIQPATRFDVDDLTTEIEQAMNAVSLKLGPTADARIKLRIVQRILPDLSIEDLDQIEDELEESALEAEQARAMASDMRDAAATMPRDAGEKDPSYSPTDPADEGV